MKSIRSGPMLRNGPIVLWRVIGPREAAGSRLGELRHHELRAEGQGVSNARGVGANNSDRAQR
jgi:hypothetical protein